jgi:nitroreductase
MLPDLVKKSRSFRRFDASHVVDTETLRELVELARFSPSAMNKQPLKFILSADAKRNDIICDHLGWAGGLPDWDGPRPGERPGGYIIILGDTDIRETFGCDHGIAAQSILLGATDRGLGGCMFGSVKRERLRMALSIPERYEILLVVAIGKPAETIALEDVGESGDVGYWRDDADVHHVPKRTLDELILDI